MYIYIYIHVYIHIYIHIYTSAFFSAVLPRGSPQNVYITIIIFRFLLGAGLGGVYPLSAAKAVEDQDPPLGGVYSLSAAKAVEDQEGKDSIDRHSDHPTIDSDSSDMNNKNVTTETDEDQENGRNNLTAPNSIHEKSVSLNKGVDSTAAALAFIWQVPGSMTPWLIAYGFTYMEISVDTQWRLLLGTNCQFNSYLDYV
jgi:hypothetical protein